MVTLGLSVNLGARCCKDVSRVDLGEGVGVKTPVAVAAAGAKKRGIKKHKMQQSATYMGRRERLDLRPGLGVVSGTESEEVETEHTRLV